MLNKRPKRTKYSKYQKGRINSNLPVNKSNLFQKNLENKDFRYLLIAMEPLRLTASHIAAGELAIKRELNIKFKSSNLSITDIEGNKINIKGDYNLHVFPHLPVTKKPAEVRMGKGKGSIDYWMTRIRIGSPIFELKFKNANINNNKNIQIRCFNIAKQIFDVVNSKLGIKTKIVKVS